MDGTNTPNIRMRRSDITVSVLSVILIIVLGVGSLLGSVSYIYIPLKEICDPSTHMPLLIGIMLTALIAGVFVAGLILIYLARKFAPQDMRLRWQDQFNQGKEKLPWITRKPGNRMLKK